MSIAWLSDINERQFDTLPENEHQRPYSYPRTNLSINLDANCNLVRLDYGCRRDRSDIQVGSDAKICGEGANHRDQD